MYLTNSICIQSTFSTLVSLRRDAINIMWQNNTSTLDGDEQAISIANDKPTKLWQTICSTPALFQAAQQPNQHPQCALGCPLIENQGTRENCSICEVPLMGKHHLLRGKFAPSKSAIGEPEPLHTGMLCSVRTAAHSWKWAVRRLSEAHCMKWEGTPWLSTTKAWSISAPTVYELRRWKSLIKCCLGQQQCVQEKESILKVMSHRGIQTNF